ncbi:uncharacterized protein [Nicotiana sylvestris]|uniref:uncharacterized protein n=1 Tax=Nicotiana sylvestris TaxID=4096 RepID=UPI00388CC804
MALYEGLYGTRCRSPVGWFELGEARLLAKDLVQDTLDKMKVIQEQLRKTQLRQKSYADRKVLDVSYMVGEKVLLRVSPTKGVMRFWKKGKLSPWFIGPFEYIGNPSHVLDFSTVQLDGDLTYDAEPVAILERHVRKMRSKDIASVKVQWRGRPMEEAIWETEGEMRRRYPHLFEVSGLLVRFQNSLGEV